MDEEKVTTMNMAAQDENSCESVHETDYVENEEPQIEPDEDPQDELEDDNIIIGKERYERILKADRLHVKKELLEALVGFPYEFFSKNNELMARFHEALAEANSNPNKRKISLKIKEFGPFLKELIGLMFRFQGVTKATQEDIDGYSTDTVEDMNESEG